LNVNDLPNHGDTRKFTCSCGAELEDRYCMWQGHELDENAATRGYWISGYHGVNGCVGFLASEIAAMRPVVERVKFGFDNST